MIWFSSGNSPDEMESQVAIGNLVQRFHRLALVNERTEWGRSLFRVPARVPVTFRARRG